MKNKNILISGAGIAGLTLAYWLRRYGFSPTLLERGQSLRTGGYKVDIRGAALAVIQLMGLHAQVSAAHTHMQGASIVDQSGQKMAEMSGETFNLRTTDDLEIVRGDLCQILMEQVKDVEMMFGDSIKSISQTPVGVKVDFEQNTTRTFDLVIGADGLHSSVRAFACGPESRFAKELGMYICIFSVPNYLNLDRWEIECSETGKLVNVYSAGKSSDAKAAFLFVSKPLKFDPRDIRQQQKWVADTYSGIGWEVPRLLAEMKNSPDFYFDSISQICMDSWSKGRVALVGDAGYCPSPVSGQGTSLALVGAYVLAGELASASGDYTKAFAQYEKELRRFVEKNQKLGRTFAKNMTSENKNKIVIWLHELLMRILPNQWINFMTNRSVQRVSDAANAIVIKNYKSAHKE